MLDQTIIDAIPYVHDDAHYAHHLTGIGRQGFALAFNNYTAKNCSADEQQIKTLSIVIFFKQNHPVKPEPKTNQIFKPENCKV